MNHYPNPIPTPPTYGAPAQAPFPFPTPYTSSQGPYLPMPPPPPPCPPPPPPQRRGPHHLAQASTIQLPQTGANVAVAAEPSKRFATLYGLGGQQSSPEYFAALDLGLFRVWFSRKDGPGNGSANERLGAAEGLPPAAMAFVTVRGGKIVDRGGVGRGRGRGRREGKKASGEGHVPRHRAVENLRRGGM